MSLPYKDLVRYCDNLLFASFGITLADISRFEREQGDQPPRRACGHVDDHLVDCGACSHERYLRRKPRRPSRARGAA